MGAQFSRMGASRSLAQRDRLLFLGGGTLLFSLIIMGSLIVYSQQTVQANQPIVPQSEIGDEAVFNTVVLVAPGENIPQGGKLASQMLKEITWPRDGVPEGAIRDFSDVQGMYAKVPLAANQPIVRTSVSPTAPNVGIGELLPPGHRAVTIEVDATSGVEGWATPGAHVDVFLTYLDQEDGVNKTRVAVEDAVVLSYDGSTKQLNSSETGRVNPASTVTLAVSFDDSLKIQTARAMGRITLALRNANDARSMGDKSFASNEWDRTQKNQKPQPSNRPVSKGFAKFSGKDGEQQFVIGNDGRWWKSDDGDD